MNIDLALLSLTVIAALWTVMGRSLWSGSAKAALALLTKSADTGLGASATQDGNGRFISAKYRNRGLDAVVKSVIGVVVLLSRV